MKTDLTEKVIPAIVRHVKPDKIFLRCLPAYKGTAEHIDLQILIPDSCSVSFAELEPLIGMAFGDEEPVPYCLYKTSGIRQRLLAGHGFYAALFREKNLVYSAGSASLPVPPANRLLDFWKKARKTFEAEMEKTDSFMEGARFYWEKDAFGLATFMLHQVTELSLRALNKALLNTDKRTHSIRKLINQAACYAPGFRAFFPDGNDDGKQLLDILQKAYLSVRYKNGPEIAGVDVEVLLDLVERLQGMAKEVFDIYEQETAGPQAGPGVQPGPDIPGQAGTFAVSSREQSCGEAATATLPASLASLQDVVDTLVQTFPLERIWCFGSRSQGRNTSACLEEQPAGEPACRYDLLVVTKNALVKESNILAFLQHRLPPGVHIFALVHTCDEVKKALEKGNRFFSHIQKKRELLYSVESVSLSPVIEEPDPQDIFQKTSWYWENRHIKAGDLLKSALVCIDNEHYEVTVALLHHCAVHTCIGMIQVFLGYHAQIHNLDRLLSLCDHFSGEPSALLPRKTDEDKRLFRVLRESPSGVRYRLNFQVDPKDAHQLYDRVRALLRTAEKLCREKIAELKALAGPVSTDPAEGKSTEENQHHPINKPVS